MSESQIALVIFMLYLYTVVCRIAYVLGEAKGEEEYRDFQRSFLGVGSVWKVGEDGKLYRQRQYEDRMREPGVEVDNAREQP